MHASRLAPIALLLLALAFPACSSDSDSDPRDVPISRDGQVRIAIQVPADTPRALEVAAEDLLDAFAQITGGEAGASLVITRSPSGPAIVLLPDAGLEDELGVEGYRYTVTGSGNSQRWHIHGATPVAVMYGAYGLLDLLGVRYLHPEQTFFPSTPDATLPASLPEEPSIPHYRWRGFHEHTQHPIEMSDYLLRPEPDFRPYVSNYIRWYARNRQNAMSWHMLDSIDIDGWLPWITDIIEEAGHVGIDVGMVLSFVDEQQNNFKIIDDTWLDDDGEIVDDNTQIRAVLDRLTSAGFRFFALQIGSSEFTKPDDDRIVDMLNTAANHLDAMDPPVRSYAWIHTTCSLKDDDGNYFFHRPRYADTTLGAWVHTTMFYTIDLPAPVYDCDSFAHHLDFLDTEHQRREQIYFPESAWWLGFDNNAPVSLPITGWSRHHDIAVALAPYDITGHITFTTGREWLYWQYDHHLTRVTWDADVTWQRYLEWTAPMFGEHGPLLASVLDRWADLQVRHFYEENPEIYFYYAGELLQDEIGEQAGILARRPKIAYRRVVRMNDADFARWRERDFDMLERMLTEYRDLRDELPPSTGAAQDLPSRLYHEAWETLRISELRLQHAIATYRGTIAIRDFVVESDAADGDLPQARRDELLALANAALDEARSISEDVIETVADIEQLYRYPLDILAEPKPETLTSYPFGYLWETRTGHFWTRRDDQLQTLIEEYFQTVPETWSEEPTLLRVAEEDDVSVIEPQDALAQDVISGFVPRMLFGFTEDALLFGQDFTRTLLPDRGTEARIPLTAQDDVTSTGTIPNYAIVVREENGLILGELLLVDPLFTITRENDLPEVVRIDATIPSRTLVDIVLQNFGIGEAGVISLLKQVFGIPRNEDLPTMLPVVLSFDLQDAPEE